jgi:hypothetical protein
MFPIIVTLNNDEELFKFMQAFYPAIPARDEFQARGQEAFEEYKRTGESSPAKEVLANLETKQAAKRKEIEAKEEAPTPAPAVEEPATEEPEEEAAPTEATYDDAKAAIKKLMVKDRAAAAAILKSLGAERLTDLQDKPETFLVIVNKSNAALKEA